MPTPPAGSDEFNLGGAVARQFQLRTQAAPGVIPPNGFMYIDQATNKAKIVENGVVQNLVPASGLPASSVTTNEIADGTIRFADLDLANMVNILVPIGVVWCYSGSAAQISALTNLTWLNCDGSSYLRTAYPALSALYSNALPPNGFPYGAVDSTHFNVPNLLGRAPIGAGSGSGLTARVLGTLLGEETHLLTVPETPSHSHGVSQSAHAHGMGNAAPAGHNHGIYQANPGYGGSATGTTGSGGRVTPAEYASHSHGGGTTATSSAGGSDGANANVSINPTGGDTAHNVMQPSAVINWMVRAA